MVVEPGAEWPTDVDGVCLTGGGDIAPERYGETDAENLCANVVPERDATELAITKWALDRDIPILGVCRGLQLINVALQGKLVIDVDGHNPAHRDGIVQHPVTPASGSRLARAIGEGQLTVNSRHHQAVTGDLLAESLEATAFAGPLVEAFESKTHRWVIGVQWHPERTVEVDERATRIFDAFVAEASRTPVTAA